MGDTKKKHMMMINECEVTRGVHQPEGVKGLRCDINIRHLHLHLYIIHIFHSFIDIE